MIEITLGGLQSMWNSEAQLTVKWRSTAAFELFIGFVWLREAALPFQRNDFTRERTNRICTMPHLREFLFTYPLCAWSQGLPLPLTNLDIPYNFIVFLAMTFCPDYTVHSESNYSWGSDVIKLRVSQTDSWCDVIILSVVCTRNLRVQPKRECCSNQQYFSSSSSSEFSIRLAESS